jgi:uncharacterized membrane protein
MSKQKKKNMKPNTKRSMNLPWILGLVAVVVVGVVIYGTVLSKATGNTKSNLANAETQKSTSAVAASGGDLVIDSGNLSATPTFISYKAGNVKMEVIAVKASDGSIRTAFNTCQVCYTSGRGYYKLEGNTLVCQNCGNRFTADQVEKEKGGCNPVPITSEYKTENNGQIVIPQATLIDASAIFKDWK